MMYQCEFCKKIWGNSSDAFDCEERCRVSECVRDGHAFYYKTHEGALTKDSIVIRTCTKCVNDCNKPLVTGAVVLNQEELERVWKMAQARVEKEKSNKEN